MPANVGGCRRTSADVGGPRSRDARVAWREPLGARSADRGSTIREVEPLRESRSTRAGRRLDASVDAAPRNPPMHAASSSTCVSTHARTRPLSARPVTCPNRGGVAERPIASVLKTDRGHSLGGSNPPASALPRRFAALGGTGRHRRAASCAASHGVAFVSVTPRRQREAGRLPGAWVK